MKKLDGLNIFAALLLPFVGLVVKLTLLDTNAFVGSFVGGALFTALFGAISYFGSKKLFAAKNTKFEGTPNADGSIKSIPTPKVVYIVTALSVIITAASILF